MEARRDPHRAVDWRDRVRLGNAALTRVVEWQVDSLPMKLFPQTPAEAWNDELADEFVPTFWSDETWRIALQTWVIEVDGLTVVGRHRGRQRQGRPRWQCWTT